MNKFCAKCLSETPHEPDDRRDHTDRPRVYVPDPGETCDFCPEQATAYATKVDAPLPEPFVAPGPFVIGWDLAVPDGGADAKVDEVDAPKKRRK